MGTLLRGLALSLRFNMSIAEQWHTFAAEAVKDSEWLADGSVAAAG